MESDSVLRNRMKELEQSQKAILGMIDQLNMKVHRFENANMRVKGKLQDVWEELLNLVENQEKSEKKQKEKLRWLQEQLKTKENEVKSQCEYFEHYKQRQKQQTVALRKRECYLRGEVFRLEKQVLDLSAHIALLTCELEEGTAQCLQKKLESAAKGTQGNKHSSMQFTELKNYIANVEHDMKSHCESFQQNLKFLRDKEEDNRRERADLLTQLQCSQDIEEFLRRKLEESCHHIYDLKISEIKLQQQINKLLDENKALKYQAGVMLKKKEEKDSQLTGLECTDNSADPNRDLDQQNVQNQKRRAMSDQWISRAAQTPVVLLRAVEHEKPRYSCDGAKQTKKLPEEPLPVLEHTSSTFANAAEELGLAEINLVTLGTKSTGASEGSFTVFRCTPNYPTARLLPPCSGKLTNGETSKGNKDEEYFPFLKEQVIHLPAKMFPVSVVEDLMRNKSNIILLKPGSYKAGAVTTVEKDEKRVLIRAIEQIKKENGERLDVFQKANADFILENNKLKELLYSLGFTYEDLRKEKSLGTKEKIVQRKEENKTQQYGVKPMNVETACSVTQTEEEGRELSSYFHSKEGSRSESYSEMRELVERTKEELKIQKKELEKSKKEAQKWYRELGFAETRYEGIKTHLTQVLSELDRLKQEAGDKALGKQHCRLMPMYTMKDTEEIEESKISNKRLQQQVLNLKAQLRDQTALQNQFHDLKNQVELLQAQLYEKTKEVQERKSEAMLTLAPLKAKLACLTRKCQERNSCITRMHGEFHRRGFNSSIFDEEVKSLVNDIALEEYTAAFIATCNQEMLPSSAEISEASGQSEYHESFDRVSGMLGSIPANSLQEADGIHCSHIAPEMYNSSPVKLTSPERIIALHRELRQNHRKNCQMPSFVSSNTKSEADPNLSMTHEETPWLKDTLELLERDWSMQGRDCLSKWDDVFGDQIGNQHASAIPQGFKQKDVITNNAWLSREKTDGSTSATTAKSSLSDMLSASNKGRNPVGRNQLHGKE